VLKISYLAEQLASLTASFACFRLLAFAIDIRKDRNFNPAFIPVRRAEAPGAGAEEVPECA
jgi:hypothetical protein